MTNYYLYALFDYNGVVRYIGKGKGGRLSEHLNPSRRDTRHEIINETLEVLGDLPKVKIADRLTEEQATELEMAFIRAIGKLPYGLLVNKTDGGKGLLGFKHSEETKKKMSQAQKGKVFSEEHKRKIGLASANRDPEVYKKISEANKGRSPSEETRAKLSEAGKGKHSNPYWSEESRQKLSRIHKGKIISEEMRAKISKANKGRKVSEATLAAVRKPRSEETKKRMSEAAKLRWQDPKRLEQHKAFHTGSKRSEEAKERMAEAQRLIRDRKNQGN